MAVLVRTSSHHVQGACWKAWARTWMLQLCMQVRVLLWRVQQEAVGGLQVAHLPCVVAYSCLRAHQHLSPLQSSQMLPNRTALQQRRQQQPCQMSRRLVAWVACHPMMPLWLCLRSGHLQPRGVTMMRLQLQQWQRQQRLRRQLQLSSSRTSWRLSRQRLLNLGRLCSLKPTSHCWQRWLLALVWLHGKACRLGDLAAMLHQRVMCRFRGMPQLWLRKLQL
mmetsp:Transcript_36119/g.80378  ORF Transcript_36119/g.80378 Transcript_36119/m.80378 type:complete len:221 (+) Transcript_36119:1767-2429(+)